MTGKYGKLFQLLSETSKKREFLPRLALDLALILPESLTFQLRFPRPGVSLDYADLLLNFCFSEGLPAPCRSEVLVTLLCS